MTHKPEEFDTLDCPHCDKSAAPKLVSAGPTVAYSCDCGTSWRIDKEGNQTHLRLPALPRDHVGVVGRFIVA